MRTLIAGLLILFWSTAPAYGAPVKPSSTGDLADSCKGFLAFLDGAPTSVDDFEQGDCLGFVRGLAEGLGFVTNPKVRACIPENVTGKQLVQVFVRWAETNPEKLHHHRTLGVAVAMKEAFPCE